MCGLFFLFFFFLMQVVVLLLDDIIKFTFFVVVISQTCFKYCLKSGRGESRFQPEPEILAKNV